MPPSPIIQCNSCQEGPAVACCKDGDWTQSRTEPFELIEYCLVTSPSWPQALSSEFCLSKTAFIPSGLLDTHWMYLLQSSGLHSWGTRRRDIRESSGSRCCLREGGCRIYKNIATSPGFSFHSLSHLGGPDCSALFSSPLTLSSAMLLGSIFSQSSETSLTCLVAARAACGKKFWYNQKSFLGQSRPNRCRSPHLDWLLLFRSKSCRGRPGSASPVRLELNQLRSRGADPDAAAHVFGGHLRLERKPPGRLFSLSSSYN
jgi:hypothetical protein